MDNKLAYPKKDNPTKSLKAILKQGRMPLSKYIHNNVKDNSIHDNSYFQKLRLMINKNQPNVNNNKLKTELIHKRSTTQHQMITQGYQQPSSRVSTGRNSFSFRNKSNNKAAHKTIVQENNLPSVSKKNTVIKMVQRQLQDQKNLNLNLKTYFKQVKKQCVDYSKYKCLIPDNQPIQKIQLAQIIGTGANAQVRIGVAKSGLKFAVKIYEKYKLLDDKKKKRVYKEINILASLNHPNIIKLIQAYEDKRQIHLLFQFVEQSKSLQDIFRNNFLKIQTNEINRIVKDVVNGLKYLHNQGCAHRDIKPDNVLVSDSKVKIIDFGFATTQNKSQLYCGTPNYMAPQLYEKIINYQPIKVDLWALGVMIYYLYQSTFPFRGFNSKDLIRNIREGHLQFKRTPQGICQVLRALLTVQPLNRLCLNEIFY